MSAESSEVIAADTQADRYIRPGIDESDPANPAEVFLQDGEVHLRPFEDVVECPRSDIAVAAEIALLDVNPVAATQPGMTARMQRNAPLKSTAMTLSKSSIDSS